MKQLPEIELAPKEAAADCERHDVHLLGRDRARARSLSQSMCGVCVQAGSDARAAVAGAIAAVDDLGSRPRG
jgi:hypothetical protein